MLPLSLAAQIIEVLSAHHLRVEPEQRGTDKVWLSTFRYSCKDCQSMDTSSDWHRQAPGTYPGSQVNEKSKIFLDGSNMAGRRGRALRSPIEVVIFAA